MAADEPASAETTVRRETSTRWAHQGLAGPWWLALLLIPLLLAALLAWAKGDDIEGDLKARADAALAAKGITGATVEADGRDLTLTLPDPLPAGVDVSTAEAAVADVEGVRVARLADDSAGAESDGDGDGDGDSDGTGAGDGTGAPGSCLDLQKKVDHILGRNLAAFGEKSATLEGEELKQVTQVGATLAACDSSVSVTGHTDNRAPATSPLSQRRADAVAAVLEKAGVTVTKAEGVGEADPIGDNNTATGRDLNRFAAIVVE
ncbi:OmpA family protein [Nocardioides cavernaquae]|uniref:OmpA family protein n=1 Tax=Nocardioides cavernaquae TaxID=2321396 RepID=A0A3A5HDD7_9ACTN|nr:OmpA family protein [Nocardioides cavernaquae]RJS47515.1 OmpA family protein [Nocardioides cavernaquae]